MDGGRTCGAKAGHPFPATEVPELRDWYIQVAAQTRVGKTVERVRVQQDPPTGYQRFERWLDQWNLRAGETMGYLTHAQAHAVGLLPAVGQVDWWLLDSSRLLLMHFDETGHRVGNELSTDPAAVAQACAWRDLVIRCSVPAQTAHTTA